MVQPVPNHLGEDSRFSPWLVVVAVAVVVVVGILLLFFSQTPSAAPVSTAPEVTPTKRPAVTRIITATPENTETPTIPPTPVYVKYTVKRGDTLSTVAKQFKVSVEAIRTANNLTDDTIKAGDVLNIPQGTPTPGAFAQGGTNGTGDATEGPPTNTPLVLRTPTLIAYVTSTAPALSTTPSPTPGVVNYIVRSGDNLGSIANVYSTTVQAIIDLNKLTGFNIKAGQALSVPVGIWTNTATPTVHLSPMPTATLQFVYGAPELVFPSDGADFAHGTNVVLEWLSPGVLRADEYYVVHLRYVINGTEHNLPGYTVSEGTSLTLDTTPSEVEGPAQFSWYVVVVRGSGCGTSGSPAGQPCAVSPLSETRGFTWR